MRSTSLSLVILLLASAASAQNVCPYAPMPQVDAKALYHSVSVTAETVSPSKRRSVGHGGGGGAPLPVANFIDQSVGAKMTRDGVFPTSIAGDEEFLRRVSIDLTGQIPDAAAVTAFVNDPSPGKRAKKIDELLASDAFVDRWTLWFGDLVQNVQVANNTREFYYGRNAYYTFIRDSIRNSKPYDQLVREVLAGKGDSFAVGQTNYVVRQLQNNGPIQDTYDNLAAHSGEKFLGMPLLCLSCHNGAGHLELVNSYLKTKTRNDFWRMAAFFARVRPRPVQVSDPNIQNLRKYDVQDQPAGNYNLNTSDGNKTPRQPLPGDPTFVTPAFLLTGEEPKTGEAYRDAYGRMLTANIQFARASVNYLWKEMFGVGLVEPVNAFDLAKLDTQPSQPELLTALANEFVAKNYDLRALLRVIANSNTYQLSAKYTPGAWNEAWVPYYARRYPHRLPAEILLDAVAKATSVPITMNVQGIGVINKATQIPDPTEARRSATSTFLNSFGRGDRDDVARTNDSSISQALALMNDPIVTTRVHRSTANSTVAKTLASTTDPGTIADQLYLATLSRKPTATERQQAIDYLRGGTLAQRAEDLQFVLLNSLEFLFN